MRRSCQPIAAPALGLLLLCAAACSSSVATSPSVAPTTAVTPSPEPTDEPATSDPSSVPPDIVFESADYRYLARIPGDQAAGEMIAAREAWDAASRIDSTGPLTDHAYLAGSRLVFVYGAPTDLELEAFAVASQEQKASWHGCPAAPESSTPVAFDGTPAILVDFDCGGLHLLSLYVVRDGFGLVVNLMNPPGKVVEDRAAFDRLLADWRWTD